MDRLVFYFDDRTLISTDLVYQRKPLPPELLTKSGKPKKGVRVLPTLEQGIANATEELIQKTAKLHPHKRVTRVVRKEYLDGQFGRDFRDRPLAGPKDSETQRINARLNELVPDRAERLREKEKARQAERSEPAKEAA